MLFTYWQHTDNLPTTNSQPIENAASEQDLLIVLKESLDL